MRAFTRSWGRDVMLYTGGVSFFALLAVFPAIAILIGVYKLGLSINEVSAQAAALSDLLPRAAQTIFHDEIARLAKASARTVSAQSAFALFVGAYAAHRGFKALLAGLNLIHDETEPHGFFKFNLLAFFVAIFAFALFTVVSGAVVTARILAHAASPGARGDNAGLMPLDALLAGDAEAARSAFSQLVLPVICVAIATAAPVVSRVISRTGAMLGVMPDDRRDIDTNQLGNLIWRAPGEEHGVEAE